VSTNFDKAFRTKIFLPFFNLLFTFASLIANRRFVIEEKTGKHSQKLFLRACEDGKACSIFAARFSWKGKTSS